MATLDVSACGGQRLEPSFHAVVFQRADGSLLGPTYLDLLCQLAGARPQLDDDERIGPTQRVPNPRQLARDQPAERRMDLWARLKVGKRRRLARVDRGRRGVVPEARLV